MAPETAPVYAAAALTDRIHDYLDRPVIVFVHDALARATDLPAGDLAAFTAQHLDTEYPQRIALAAGVSLWFDPESPIPGAAPNAVAFQFLRQFGTGEPVTDPTGPCLITGTAPEGPAPLTVDQVQAVVAWLIELYAVDPDDITIH